MRTIGGLLGRSPYGPAHEHMAKVQESVDRLIPILEAYFAGQYDRVRDLLSEISRLEGEADSIKTEIREELSHSLFSAAERGDIMSLLKAQDDVADDCQAVARYLDLRQACLPPDLAHALLDLAKKSVESATALTRTTELLRGVPGGASPKESVAETIRSADSVRAAEHEVEEKTHVTLKRVFQQEGQLDSVAVILLMQIVKEVADIAHSAENAADCITRLLSGR